MPGEPIPGMHPDANNQDQGRRPAESRREEEVIREEELGKIVDPAALRMSYVLRESSDLKLQRRPDEKVSEESDQAREDFVRQLTASFLKEEFVRLRQEEDFDTAKYDMQDMTSFLEVTLPMGKPAQLQETIRQAGQGEKRRQIAYLGQALRGLTQHDYIYGQGIVQDFENAGGKEPYHQRREDMSEAAKQKTKELILTHLGTINEVVAASAAEREAKVDKPILYRPDNPNLSNDPRKGLAGPLQEYGIVYDDSSGAFIPKELREDPARAADLEEARANFQSSKQRHVETIKSVSQG